MASMNPMFQPTDLRVKNPTPVEDAVRRQVCKACGDAAVSAVRDAVQVAQQEASNLQLQLLDLESDVLFDFNNMQTEILDLQHAAENLQRQLEESDQKRLCEQQLKQELEQQVLQLSDEVLNLKLALAFPPEREQDEQTLGKHDFFGRPDAARLAVGFHAEQPGTPDQDCELKGSMPSTSSSSVSAVSEGAEAMLRSEVEQLRDEHRTVTEELLHANMELAACQQELELARQRREREAMEDLQRPTASRRPWTAKWGQNRTSRHNSSQPTASTH